MGCLKPLPPAVMGRRADYQRFATQGSRVPDQLARRAQPLHAAVTTEQLQRFKQRRADGRAGGGHPDGAERLAGFERQTFDQGVLKGRLDQGAVQSVTLVSAARAASSTAAPSGPSSLAAALGSITY